MNNFVKTETSSVNSFKVTHYQVIFTFARNATISHIVTININKTASRAGTNWRGSSNYTGAVGGKSKCICIHDFTKRKLYQSISPFDE